MKTSIKVCDAMTRKPVAVDKKTNLNDAAITMRRNNISSLIVEDGQKTLEGLITLTEFVYKAIALGMDTKVATVEDIMVRASEIISVSPSSDISEAIDMMNKHDIQQLPVLDTVDNKLVGLITRKDILRIEPQMMEIMSEKLSIGDDEDNSHIFSKKYSSGICGSCNQYSDLLLESSGLLMCPECRSK